MSRREFSVSYHGKDRKDDHSIDVQILAPALLAFGKLLREANTEINNKKSTTKVMVVSDFEHKCFNINFELLVSLYEQAKSLVSTEQAKNAKDVLEWVGLVTAPPSTALLSYLGYLRWKNGRKTEVKSISDKDVNGTVHVTIPGEQSTVHVHNHIYALSQNPAALRATRDALSPLGQEGFDRVDIADGVAAPISIDMQEADEIIASCTQGIDDSKIIEPDVQTTTAWLSVYSPVYDIKAGKWRFLLGTDVIYADISSTRIAQEAISRGGAMIQDAYQVKLEINIPVDPKGNHKEPEYKVIEVIRFIPAVPNPVQQELL